MPPGQDIFRAFAGRRIVVTGATGFLGRWVARALTAAGADLWLVARDADALAALCDAWEIRGRHCVADLAAQGEFTRIARDAQPAATFHLAGYGVDREERDADLAQALNARLPGEIAASIARDTSSDWPGLRLVHTGSAFEYGAVEGPVQEDSSTAPTSLYGQTKLAGTRQLLEVSERTGLRAGVARLFTVYGPGEHAGRLLPSLLRAAQTGETLALTAGEQRRDFTYVGDVAEGLLRLALLPQASGAVNLATGRQTAVREFVACAAELLQLKPGQLQLGALPYREDEVRQGAVDTTRLEQLLGWRPATPIREGIAQTIAWEARAAGAKIEKGTRG